MLTKVLIFLGLGVILAGALLGIIVFRSPSLLLSSLAKSLEERKESEVTNLLGTMQEIISQDKNERKTLGIEKTVETVNSVQEVRERTTQIIEVIKNLPEGELREIKKQLKQDICDELLGEE